MPQRKVLVTGWFSFEQMGATAGDLLARDVACEWLTEAGYGYDVALAAPFRGGLDWRKVEPRDYSHLLFVCGPFHYCEPLTELFGRFPHCTLVGLNLSMLAPLREGSHPFHVLFERDSSEATRPDVVFAASQPKVPVVGLVLVHPQKEYKDRGRHKQVNQAFRRLIDSREMAVVPIDTRLDENGTGLRTPGEIESLIARMDVVLTTRLHGTVFAIKNGVPAVVVDAIAGGAKVLAHARTIGWPAVFVADEFDDDDLQRAYAYCLTDEARQKARECRENALAQVERLHREFVERFRHDHI